jgi:hypothetical protein
VTERLDGHDLIAYSQAITVAPGKVKPTLDLTAARYGGETVGVQIDQFHLIATVTDPLEDRGATGTVVYAITGAHAGLPFGEETTHYMYDSVADRQWAARHWVEDGDKWIAEYLDPGDYQFQAHYLGDATYEEAWSPVRRVTILESRDGPTVVHTITAGVDGSGVLSPLGEVPVTAGNSVTFEAKANPGHVFAGFTVDGQSVAGIPAGDGVYTHEFAAVGAAHQITARFSAILDLTPQEVAYDGRAHHFAIRIPEAAGLPDGTAFTVRHSQGGAPVADPTAVGAYPVAITRPADAVLPA